MMSTLSSPSRKQFWSAFLITAAGTLLLFLVLTWPLGKFWNEGIPSSAQNIENPAWRSSIPGDHLQLLYHFDLVSGMFSGEIPWMHNVYEFNTGSVEERFRPGSYFFPMSAVYAGLKIFYGQAAAWNTTLWISVWFSAFFTWLWLRRFTDKSFPIFLGVLLILLVPSRWISLLGGSPAGFALLYVPLYAICVDAMIRKPSYRSGFGAGLCLLLLMWADLQTFYFSVVTSPVLLLISLTAADEEILKNWKSRLKGLPGLFFFLVVIAVFYTWRKQHLIGSAMEHGRSPEELALYSPFKRSFFIPGSGKEGKVYFGWGTLTALVLAGGCAWTMVRSRMFKLRLQTVAWLLLIPAILFCAFLANGIYGPADGLPIRLVRKLIPHYDMIRQPAKIMLVFPMWIGWLLAVTWSALWPQKISRFRGILLGVCVLWMGVEFRQYVSATISLLPEETIAYAIMKKETPQPDPHLLVIPLWPGESSETSVPMILAQQTKIPLVNGYSPVVSVDYMDKVVLPLESINMGVLTETQIELLASMGIQHLVVHENMFPEKVSPFPIIQTLDRLEAHPRLEKMMQQGSVHTYKILPAPVKKELGIQHRGFPSRVWRFDPETGCSAEYKMPPSSRQHLLMRVKGKGVITLQPKRDGVDLTAMVFNVDSEDWVWRSFPFPGLPQFGRLQLCLGTVSETAEVDRGLIMEGEWPEVPLQNILRIPAVEFFHAGHVVKDGSSVKLRRSHEPDTIVFYGPRMPLGKGKYRVELSFSSEAISGTELGAFRLRAEGQSDGEWMPVTAGEPAALNWNSESNLPVDLQFRFTRAADLQIHEIVFIPLEVTP